MLSQVPVLSSRQLIILGHASQAPAIAKCTNCELKFFVPKELMKDPDAARAYLLSKFDWHTCKFAAEWVKPLPDRW